MIQRHLPWFAGLLGGLVVMRIARGGRAPYSELACTMAGGLIVSVFVEIWLWRKRVRARRSP